MSRPPINPAAEEIIGGYFPVLDHGFIALLDVMGSDEAIEQAARLSYGAGTRKSSETRGLIRYLMRHKHTSPFEQVELKFHVCMPIFVARQWIRHRTANVNEYSGRYSLMPLMFYTPDAEHFQLQAQDNKQGRSGTTDPELYEAALENWAALREASSLIYEGLVEEDVARELARIDLPLSTYTQWVWKIDLHNLFHFLTLRVDPHAQYEIRAYGEIMAGMVKRVAPLAYEAWIDYRVAGCELSYQDMNVLRSLLHVEATPFIEPTLMGEGLVALKNCPSLGLSVREATELFNKFWRTPAFPDFELDLSLMKEPSYFEEKIKAFVPNIDRT